MEGTVELCTPNDWKVTPAKTEISLKRKGEEQYFEFMLTPPEGQAQGMIVPLVKLAGEEDGHTRKLVKIEHDHIPMLVNFVVMVLYAIFMAWLTGATGRTTLAGGLWVGVIIGTVLALGSSVLAKR